VVELLTHTLPEQIGASWALLTPPHAPEVAPYADYESAWSMRLALGSQLFGRIWLGPRRSGLAYNQSERTQFDSVARQASLALAHADLIAELRSLNQSLEQRVLQRTTELLDRERLLAQVAERQRLARDLHDSVTQALFSLSLGARALRLQAQHNQQHLAEELTEQEQTAQQALSEMRALLHQLRAPAEQQNEQLLVDLGTTLAAAAQAIATREQLALQSDLAVAIRTTPELASELSFIVREALQNVARHSGVCAAVLRLSYQEPTLIVQVSDRGNGFDQHLLIPEQLGIRGMRERIEALGGTLTIRGAPGAGTDLLVQIPYQHTTQETEKPT
jgi:signal transduction histidine kinase